MVTYDDEDNYDYDSDFWYSSVWNEYFWVKNLGLMLKHGSLLVIIN
jgi:hypothetical protein